MKSNEVFEKAEEIAADFLGREFLLWLWYRSEVGMGAVQGASGEEQTLWVEERLVLQGEGKEGQRFDLRAGAPGASSIPRAALQQGVSVAAARFGVNVGEREFHVELHQDLSMRSLKLPEWDGDEEDKLSGRIGMVEELVQRLDDLYEGFCVLRLGDRWEAEELPAIRAWLAEG